jgi:glycosyltransferase involved in cell wall biosynthesis
LGPKSVLTEIVINGRFLTQDITGVQRYARELLSALDVILDAEPNIRLTVISPRLVDAPPVWRNISLRQVGHLRGHVWEQFELPWYSRGKTLFCAGNTAPVVSLLGTQPVIVTVHDLSYKYFPEAYSWAFRLWYEFNMPLVLRYARSVVTVSESERRAIIAHYPEADVRLRAISHGGLPAGLAVDALSVADRGESYVLYVGSLSKRKNFPLMFEAACRLAREHGFNFVFVGDAPRGLVASALHVPNDIASKIKFVGNINDTADLISYYQGAACFLFPSLYESSGLPPIEAMACGCPVIVSEIPALRERCGDAAIYCDPYDIDSIISAVVCIMGDAALRSKLSAAGHQRAIGYTWKACARATLDLLLNAPDTREHQYRSATR